MNRNFLLLIILFVILIPRTANASSIIFQEGDGGAFSQTDGTYIESTRPDLNLGNYAYLYMATPSDPAAPARKALLGFFNIFGNNDGKIPHGSTINTATLTLNGISGDGHAMIPLDIAWNEYNATWNNFGSAAGGVAGIDWDPGQAIYFSLNGYRIWTNVDVASIMQEWSDGRDNYGWIMTSPVDQFGWKGKCIIPSDNYYSHVSYLRPKLTVDYASPIPEPSTMLLLSFGLMGAGFFRRKRVKR